MTEGPSSNISNDIMYACSNVNVGQGSLMHSRARAKVIIIM